MAYIDGFIVYIIESLQEGDIKTGENLKDEIRQFQVDYPGYFIDYQYNVISNKEKLFSILIDISESINNSKVPIIQIESHGDEKGFLLTSGEFVKWHELFDYIRPINVNSCNSLLLTLSMCNGEAIIKEIDPRKRAPFKAVIGPNGEILPIKLQNAWFSFYKNLFKTWENKEQYFFCNLAESCGLLYFNQDFIFDIHYDTPNLFPELFDLWIKMNVAEMYRNEGPLMLSREMYKKWYANKFKKAFDAYKPYYCFYDV